MKKEYNAQFTIKSQTKDAEGNLSIEGYANRATKDGNIVVDRGMDHIASKEWKFAEWMENPIVFFNHDRDMPIGKGVGVKVDDGGLFVKIEISKSDDPVVKKVRDFIKEGILKTFSVGIDVGSEEKRGDVWHLSDVNLLEVSVVSIPMNKDSSFSISKQKMLETDSEELICDILEDQGAKFAAKVRKKFVELAASDDEFNREEAISNFCTKTEMSLESINEMLNGNDVEFDEMLEAAFIKEFDLEADEADETDETDELEGDEDPEDPEDPAPEGDEDPAPEGDEDPAPEGDEDPAPEGDEDPAPEADPEKSHIVAVAKVVKEALTGGMSKTDAMADALVKCAEEIKGKKLDSKAWEDIFKLVEETTKDGPMGTNTPLDAGNAMLQAATQGIVLLGQVIGELQNVRKQIEAMGAPQEQQSTSNGVNADNGLLLMSSEDPETKESGENAELEADAAEQSENEELDNSDEYNQNLDNRLLD